MFGLATTLPNLRQKGPSKMVAAAVACFAWRKRTMGMGYWPDLADFGRFG